MELATPKNAAIDFPSSVPETVSPSEKIFSGGGELGALMRTIDWSATPLGPIENWSKNLKTCLRIVLTSRQPMFVWWGKQLVNLYNDAYRSILGGKHPAALGQPASVVWQEIWKQIGPRAETALRSNEGTYDEALMLIMERYGYPEETYYTFSYSPVPDDDGGVGGIICANTDDTQRIIGERQLALLGEMAARAAHARTWREACRLSALGLSTNPKDICFALLYAVEDGKALLAGCTKGIESNATFAPEVISLQDDSVWPVGEALTSHEIRVITAPANKSWTFPSGAWDRAPDSIAIVPVAPSGPTGRAGVLVIGLNPYRKPDEAYCGFLKLLAGQISASIANAEAYEQERQRAETLAELDRAKTDFFSNVSHEFRTPLTLMLGPLEEMLIQASDRLAPEDIEHLTIARRNALRLLKLVNSLLDFSRIEAGRPQAIYEPMDLPSFTAGVASVFRAAMEKAGLRFIVDCKPLHGPVYVDREMWEKILLNLLSNAFKFTLAGEVAVTLRESETTVELSVRDTGAGIPENELAGIFDRFHRVRGMQGRSYEGTGIGLALVHEMVKLHGGSLHVESVLHQGSTFTISIPKGKDHLPSARVGTACALPSAVSASKGFIEEAARWVPEVPPPAPSTPGSHQDLVLLADDNADMREYVSRLLHGRYRVHTVSDGEQALEAAKQLHPDLVLTDVMMPRLDGFGVLNAIRSNPDLESIPVILLSARAGEESRVEGLDAGADDYLVKPFTARELLARVGTHLRLAKIRRETAEREQKAFAEAETERRRLRELFKQAPAAIGLLTGPEHRWEFVNDLVLRLTGRTQQSGFLGRTVRETLPELEGQGILELLDQVYRTGVPAVGQEVRIVLNRAASGLPSEGYFNFTFQPVRDAEGNVNAVLIHAIEVTEQVSAHHVIEESARVRTTLAAIVEWSDDAIISKDLNGIVTSWNAAAEQIFGHTAQEMVGQSILTIVPPDLHSDEEMILSTIRRGERIHHFETVRMTKSGELIDVSLSISPIRDAYGKVIGAAKIARDITRKKRSEEALRISERLASVGRLAATIAHEINNPLEATTNLVYLARQSAEKSDVIHYLDSAQQELARVSQMARQTLGFYRAPSTRTSMHVGSLLDSVVAIFQPRARNKDIQLQAEIRQDPEITAVPGEVRQLLINLVGNSIDAVRGPGIVRLRVSAARHRPGVFITVGDTGSGIPLGIRKKIFEPFFTTKEEIGTGLGLWICRDIVLKHGGEVRLKSSTTPGKSWTVFSIFLPSGGK